MNKSNSSYARILNQITANDYLRQAMIEAHKEFYAGFKIVRKVVNFSNWSSEDRSYICVIASGPRDQKLTLDMPTVTTGRENPYFSFPWIQDHILTEILQPLWKSSIKTYNIPLAKFVKWWAEAWSTPNQIPYEYIEFVTVHREAKESLYAKMIDYANEDIEETLRQGALDAVMKFFGSNHNTVKHLSIEDVRGIAELEQMRRVHL